MPTTDPTPNPGLITWSLIMTASVGDSSLVNLRQGPRRVVDAEVYPRQVSDQIGRGEPVTFFRAEKGMKGNVWTVLALSLVFLSPAVKQTSHDSNR